MPIPYSIKSFRGGVSDEADKGVPGAFKHGYGLAIHERNDSLSCKYAAQTVLDSSKGIISEYGGTTMTGIINVFLPLTDGTTLAFSDRGSIFARNGTEGSWMFVYNDENGAIKGAAEWEDDGGANYVYWATSTQVSRKRYPGSSSVAPDTGEGRWADVTNNWKTENVLLTDWHTMKPANGSLYMGNGESLAEIPFTADGWDPQIMNIRPGNEIKALEERNDLLILGSTRPDGSEEGHVWSWVSTALNWVQKKKIPVKGINALIYTELPLAQGGASGEFFYSDLGGTPVPLNGIEGGGQANPYGVTIEDDIALFGIYGGTYPGLWSYGRKRKNRPFSLNYDYRLAKTVGGSTISTIGAILQVNDQIIASWGTTDGSTSEYGVDQVSSTTRATAFYEGLEFDAARPYMLKKFNTVMLTMAPLPTGTSVSVKYKLNKQSTWEYALTGGTSTTFSETNATAAEFLIGDAGYVYEVGLELNSSGSSTPEVLSITTWIDGSFYEHGGTNYPSL